MLQLAGALLLALMGLLRARTLLAAVLLAALAPARTLPGIVQVAGQPAEQLQPAGPAVQLVPHRVESPMVQRLALLLPLQQAPEQQLALPLHR